MIPFIERDWPESSPQEYTRVVLVSDASAKSGYTESESQEYDRARGKIDSILAYKKEVDVSTILDPVPSPDSNKLQAPKVLMDGAPGVGKTTLTLNACKEWAENHLFKQYDLVLLVPLRQASYREAKDIEELLPGDNPDLNAKVVQYIREKHGENIAFIFDGYDELSYDQRRRSDSLFMKIFRGKMLTKCAIWITSRPYTSNELKEGPSIINRHIEVLGFNKEQIYSCIRKRIEDISIANNLISQLEEREDIASLCYIPLVCIIMIHVYKSHLAKSPNSHVSLPATMTKLVESFLLDMLAREVLVVENNIQLDEDDFCDIYNLPDAVSERLGVLDSLAYDFLIKDKFVFTYSELKSIYGGKFSKSTIRHCCLGLLSSATSIGKNTDEHFQFVHLSIQEFLAARYIRRTLKHDDQMDIFYQHFGRPRFGQFLLFFAGMIPLNEDLLRFVFSLGFKKLSNIHEKTSTSGENLHVTFTKSVMYYMNLIFESQQFKYFSCLYDCLPDKSVLNLSDQRMALFDCRLLTHFLCSVNQIWESLDISNCSLTLDSIKVMNNVLKNYYSGLRISSIIHVDLSKNDPDVLNNLTLFPWLDGIQELNFQIFHTFEQKSITPNLEFLCHIPKLCIKRDDPSFCVSTTTANVVMCSASLGEGRTTYLENIKKIELRNVDRGIVNKVISGNCLQNLEVLIIENVDADVLLSEHAAKICSSTVLHKLTLSGIGLSRLATLSLLESLINNTSIQVLDISCNPTLSTGLQYDKVGPALEKLLVTNQNIKELTICGGTLDEKLAQYLIVGLQRNTGLKCLSMNQNNLTLKTICNVITTSDSHRGLSQLHVEDVQLQRSDLLQPWKLDGHSRNSMKVFSVVSKLHGIVSLDYAPISYITIFNSEPCDHCAAFFLALRDDKHVNTLSFSSITLDTRFGYAMDTMLTYSKVLHHIELHKCILPESVLTHLRAGLSGNTSLKTLSFTCAKDSHSVIHVLQALQHNNSVKELDLSDNASLLVQDNFSQLTASVFEDLLKSNYILAKINLQRTYVNDIIASGFARGLTTNKGLKILDVSLSMLKSDGIKDILVSSCKNRLQNFNVHPLCSFNRKDECGWELVVSHEYSFWPHLQHMHLGRERFCIESYKLEQYGLLAVFQFERTLNALAKFNNTKSSLTFLDLSHHYVRSSSIDDFQSAKDIGIALKELLINCSCLKKLIMKHCKLPQGTWKYAAKGLSEPSCSLKYLNVSECGITASEAESIFKHVRTIQELDLSDNEQIIAVADPNCNERLCEATKQALLSNLQVLNVKNSINDKVALAIATALKYKSNLQSIELSEQQLSFDTIQKFFMLMVQDESLLTDITFNDVKFHRSATVHDFWLNVVNMFTNSSATHSYKRLCKSSTLFCGLCTVQQYQHQLPFHNVTSVELNNIDHSAMAVLSQSVQQSFLPKLAEVTLAMKQDTCNRVALGQQLQRMLENSNSLSQMSLYGIDTALTEHLSNGIVSAQSLKTVRITMTDHDLETFIGNEYFYLAKLLKAIESSTSLQTICVYKLPTIRRRSINSDWCLALSIDENFPFYGSEKEFPLLPWIICSVSDICNDQDLCSHTAESISLSCSNLKVHSSCDTSLITRLFRCLASNHTLQELDLSENLNIARSDNKGLCQAIEMFMSKNISLKVLKFSGSLNDDTASALIAGLEKNHVPKHVHLHVTTKSLKITTLSNLAILLEHHSLYSLTVTGIFIVSHYRNSRWHIKVIDPLLCSRLLVVLMKNSSSRTKLWCSIKTLMDIGCLYDGSPLLFDISHENIHFQCPTSNNLLSTRQSCTSPRICDIEHFLMNISTLKHLVLSGCNISDDGCRQVASGLAITSQLTKLDLSANFINDSGMIILCQALQKLPVLEDLNMSFNQLSSTSEHLGPALKMYLESNEVIKRLDIQACNISNLICKFIGLAMSTNRSLNFLDMSGNQITSEGANILLDSLQYNNIHELNLSDNGIFTCDSNDGQTLQRIFAAHNHLTSLNLNSGAITSSSISGIVVGLNRNKSLEDLTLDFSQCICNPWVLRTLLVESNSHLVRVNHSNLLSFIRTDSGWKVELKSLNIEALNFVQYLLQADLNINEVTVSNLAAPITVNISLHFQLMIGVVTSLESCSTLTTLGLYIDRNLQHNNEVLGNALEQIIGKNSSLKHLELYGIVSDTVAARIIDGLSSRRHSSIEVLSIETSRLSSNLITGLMEIFQLRPNKI
jgi:Ran GTPase-activating protein (RanGAP) involved in mRNA processing and transport